MYDNSMGGEEYFGRSFLLAARMGSLLTDPGIYRPGIYRQIQDPQAFLAFGEVGGEAVQSPAIAFRALADYVWNCAMNGQTPEQIRQAFDSWNRLEGTEAEEAFPYLTAQIFLPDEEDPESQLYLANTVSVFIEALIIAETVLP